MKTTSLAILLSVLGSPLPAYSLAWLEAAQPPVGDGQAEGPWLTIDRIFGSNEFHEDPVEAVSWSRRSQSYVTTQPSPQGAGRDLIRRDVETGATAIVLAASQLVPPGQSDPLAIDEFAFSEDETRVLIFTNSQRVWRRNTRGDYWIVDLATNSLRKLGGNLPSATMMFATLSPDASHVAFVHAGNLYVQQLQNMQIRPLTTDGSDTIINGTSDWVNEEELDIRHGFRWSPDGQSIAYWQFDTSGVPRFHLVNATEGNYPRVTSFAYPKAGEQNSATRLGVVSLNGGPTQWLDVPGDPRNHYLPRMEWSPDGSSILLQQMNRLQNTNRVMLADPKSGRTQTILTETDSAWLENENPVRWIAGGRRFVWLSERDGWRHIYLAGIDGQQWSQVTRGDFDVISIEAIDEAGGWIWFAASPDNPTQRYLYRCRLDGSGLERRSPVRQPGWHSWNISPDARWAVQTWSTLTSPPVTSLIRLSDHAIVRVLADNQRLRTKLGSLQLPKAEMFRIDAGIGIPLDAWCLMPPNPGANPTFPLLIHVYGEPHGQTVRDAWSGSRGLWHSMLAQQGYIVASVENRGTNVPRGRAWRKIVHRQIGILASQDQAAATRALLQRWPFADPARVGIWGWSGGGSMSLNAIFRYPELYRTAMAIAPVPKQALYDTIYQERYMGLPSDNPDGYRDGSPLTFASRLQGRLLLVHGTGDDNCHYQGVELLMNELIRHNRMFTVLPYPNRSHAVSEGPNTTRHLFTLLTGYLRQNLPTGTHAN